MLVGGEQEPVCLRARPLLLAVAANIAGGGGKEVGAGLGLGRHGIWGHQLSVGGEEQGVVAAAGRHKVDQRLLQLVLGASDASDAAACESKGKGVSIA